MTKKSILGTPLGSLLSSTLIQDITQPGETPGSLTEKIIAGQASDKPQVSYLSIERLVRSPYQPRKKFNEESLQELSDSIRTQGVLQPIVVRVSSDPKYYEIIAGERRWRAAQMAELKEVPVIIRHMNDKTALAVAMIENLQREDLNPLEEAMGLEKLAATFDLTHQALAEIVGKSRARITNLLRLLTLRSELKLMLETRELEMGHARALLSLTGLAQVEAARWVVQKGLSVRQTEEYVRNLLDRAVAKPVEPLVKKDPDVAALEQRLSELLATSVNIEQGRKTGSGKLVISYHSLEALDGILARLEK